MFSHTIILVWRKLGINKGKSNKERGVTKQCYVTHYEKIHYEKKQNEKKQSV